MTLTSCVPCCDEATALRLEGTAKGGTCDPEIAHATDQMCNPKETDVQDASPGEDAFKERFRCLEKLPCTALCTSMKISRPCKPTSSCCCAS